MGHPRTVLIGLLVACWFGGTATAGVSLAAAGVLERNGATDCSAVLIAPDLIATAGHCANGKVVAAEGGEDRILFRTGTYPGRPGSDWEVAGVFVHPMFHGSQGKTADALRHDAAILLLAEPVPDDLARPVELDETDPVVGERLLLATWPGGAGQRARERRCPVVDVTDGIMTLECQVRPGESGGAVLRLTETGPRLVGIVVAQATSIGRPGAIAVTARSQITQIRAIYLE